MCMPDSNVLFDISDFSINKDVSNGRLLICRRPIDELQKSLNLASNLQSSESNHIGLVLLIQ